MSGVAPRGHIDPKTGEFKLESFDLVHEPSVDPSSLSITWANGPGPEPSVVDRVASIENQELAQEIADYDERRRRYEELVQQGMADRKRTAEIYAKLSEQMKSRTLEAPLKVQVRRIGVPPPGTAFTAIVQREMWPDGSP